MIGRWLTFSNQMSGGKPRSVTVDQLADVTDRRCPPLEGPMSQSRSCGRLRAPASRVSAADRPLRNSVGAIGSPWPSAFSRGFGLRWGRSPDRNRVITFCPRCPSRRVPGVRPLRRCLKIVTWLILPVVICLSQRLSHACLSISNHTVKLRMAH